MSDQLPELEHLIASAMDSAFEGAQRSLAGEIRRRAAATHRQAREQAFRQLVEALGRLDVATTQAEVLERLLEEGGRFASRTALLLTFADGARGWGAYGFGDSVEPIDRLEVAWDREPWRQFSAGTGTVVLEGEQAAALAELLGAPPPREGVLIPLVLRDRVAAALYADRLVEDDGFAPAALQVLAHAAAHGLELLGLRQRRATPTLRAAAPDREGLALWDPGEMAAQPAAAGDAAEPTAAATAPPPPAAEAEAVTAEEESAAGAETASWAEIGTAPAAVADEGVVEEAVEPVDSAAGWAFEDAVGEEAGDQEATSAEGPIAAEPVAWEEEAAEPVAWEEEAATVEPAEAEAMTPAPFASAEEELRLPAVDEAEPEVEAVEDGEPELEAVEEAEPEVEVVEEGPAMAAVEEGEPERPGEAAGAAAPQTAEGVPEATIRIHQQALENRAGVAAAAPEWEEVDPSEDRTVRLERSQTAPTPPPGAPPATAPGPQPEPPAAEERPPHRPIFAGSTEVAPPPDLEGPGWAFRGAESDSTRPHLPRDEESSALHEEARRLARLLVSEIKLYNEEQVEEGRRQRDLYSRLQEDINRSRQMYEERIDPRVRDEVDYFQQEVVNILAGGDAAALGR
ncbi:MAG TPA: hypothetical protein VMT16_07810 [Thermoanaerobaculia bacterium]|nr:hypothetical protein [Thermoanaerobaculia bacterium]